MSKASEQEVSKRVRPKPDVLRRNVVEQLDRLPDEGIAVLHDLAQELGLRAAWADFSAGMAEDWAAGKYDHLDQALADARAAIRDRVAE